MTIVARAAAERRGQQFDEGADAERSARTVDSAEKQSLGLYATSRVSDDAMIDPRDTRTVVAMALSACHSQTVEGARGYGVFRM